MTHHDPLDCLEFLERYSEYDDSLIPAAEADRFRAHMAECAACARYDRVLRKGRMLARQLAAVEPSDAFVPRLRARLGTDSRLGEVSTVRAARLSMGLAGVTVLLAAATALALAGGGPAPVPTTTLPPPEVLAIGAPPGSATTAGWAVPRVDPAAGSSYSPLVTGPPAYRGGALRRAR